MTPEQIADAQVPIVLVEGEKKALALWRLAWHDAEEPRFIPIAIAGVWNWRGKVGKANGPHGAPIEIRGPIADLSRINWKTRKTFVVFDANVHNNDSVSWARKGISRELTGRGAAVQIVNLPEDCGVNGIDDLLAVWGPTRVLPLFDRAMPVTWAESVAPQQFRSEPEGLFRVTAKGEQFSRVQLTNYQATIIGNIVLDDGVETRREFEIEAEVTGRTKRFTVSAANFPRMDWPIERLGSGAITYPNQRDYARTAIQTLSTNAPERRIYTHTGWREVDGSWVFLHGGGGIGGSGAVPDANVSLSGAMRSYELRLTRDSESLTHAVRASLSLIDLGPNSISIPLFAATYRAVFGGGDFAIHLAGETGAFKSEIAALHQQHFGAAMDRRQLPGAWSSTGNALEVSAFQAKDALFVIDDFAPQGNGTDVARYHATAERVFRAAGNNAGRGRLDQAATLRESKPPRALILSTGEDVPRGHSVRARLLILELAKGSVKASALTRCQQDAKSGLYAEAMGGFVRWLADGYIEKLALFNETVLEHRESATFRVAHARTPDIVANLEVALGMFLRFADECGALTPAEHTALLERGRNALRAAAAGQAKYHAASEPAQQYLVLIRAALSSGKVHLAPRGNESADLTFESCGWRRMMGGSYSPQGDCIGWISGDDVYLDPTAAYGTAQAMARDIGECQPVSEQTMRKRLNERAILASVDEKRQTLTVRKTIGGYSKDVLHLRRATLLPIDDEDTNVG